MKVPKKIAFGGGEKLVTLSFGRGVGLSEDWG